MSAPRPHPGPLALALALALCAGTARALEGRYRVEGRGPEGAARGHALVERSPVGQGWLVTLKTADAQGRERRLHADGAAAPDGSLRFGGRAEGDLGVEPPLRARAAPGAAGLRVDYRDDAGRSVREEVWTPDERVVVPVAIVALTGGARFAGVSRDEAVAAQEAIIRALDRAFAATDLRFAAVFPVPAPLDGARFDRDGDGTLGREETALVRDELERRGLKRPGRVVLVLTASPIVGVGCRGWTLGDAPATPHSLGDVNDNISLVGLRWVDPRAHTIPHEVAHQLGLDDIGPENRRQLARPDRDDQLMESGGTGFFLDPEHARLLRRTARYPDHGLEGRRGALRPVALPEGEAPAPAGPGLPGGPAAPRGE